MEHTNDHIHGIPRQHIEDFILFVQTKSLAAPDPDKIYGIERDVVERFLRLVRDKYHKADEANFFLELNLGISGLTVAVTNQRDVLSHLATIITRQDMTRDQKMAQLGDAEEHLRRATLESYAVAVNFVNQRALDLYDEYRTTVPLLQQKQEPTLSSAPTINALEARFRKINELRTIGRAAKGENEWNAAWEAGVHAYITAFHQLREMQLELEDYLARAKDISDTREVKALHWAGIALAVLLFGLGIVIEHYVKW